MASEPFYLATVDQSWRRHAACIDMDVNIFFVERGHEARIRNAEAKAICQGCPVRFECLESALEEPQPWFGVRGGLTPKERLKIRWRPRRRNA